MKLVFVLLLTLVALGCGYGSMHNYNNTMTGSCGQNVTNRSQFCYCRHGWIHAYDQRQRIFQQLGGLLELRGPGHQVYFRKPAYSQVPASEVAMPATIQVYVNSNGTTSNMMQFTVN